MVDGYHWPADARAENGEHIISYIVKGLRAKGVSVIPVVGYDRWGNARLEIWSKGDSRARRWSFLPSA